jgi:hypothetical protein
MSSSVCFLCDDEDAADLVLASDVFAFEDAVIDLLGEPDISVSAEDVSCRSKVLPGDDE